MWHAITTLPTVPKTTHFSREVSQGTRDLFTERVRLGRRKDKTKAEFKVLQKKIKQSSLQDFADWVDKWIDEMKNADAVGASKRIWRAVKTLSGKVNKKPAKNLTVAQGKPIDSPEALAQAWHDFLAKKFAATKRELEERQAHEELPARDPENVVTPEEVREAINKLNNNKAVGPDKIPIGVYKYIPKCKELLVALIQ